MRQAGEAINECVSRLRDLFGNEVGPFSGVMALLQQALRLLMTTAAATDARVTSAAATVVESFSPAPPLSTSTGSGRRRGRKRGRRESAGSSSADEVSEDRPGTSRSRADPPAPDEDDVVVEEEEEEEEVEVVMEEEEDEEEAVVLPPPTDDADIGSSAGEQPVLDNIQDDQDSNEELSPQGSISSNSTDVQTRLAALHRRGAGPIAGSCPYQGVVPTLRKRELLTSDHFNREKRCDLLAKRLLEISSDSSAGPPLQHAKDLLDKLAETTQELRPEVGDTDYTAKAFEYVRALLVLSRRVDVSAQRLIGEFLSSTPATSTPSSLLTKLADKSSDEKAAHYRRLLEECSGRGCQVCSSVASGGSGSAPCDIVQALCRLEEESFENLTSAFLTKCIQLARLGPHTPVLCAADHRGQLRDLVSSASSLKKPMEKLGLSPLIDGRFSMAEDANPVEAVQYVDGDGGHIVAEKFPGLLNYLRCQRRCPEPIVYLPRHRYTLLPFREMFHDAVELGHEYTVKANHCQDNRPLTTHTAGSLPLGYDALVAARGNLSRARRVWIIPGGVQG